MRKFPLDAEGPGNQRRGLHFRLNSSWHQLRSSGERASRVDGKLGDGERSAVDRIERRVLIRAVPKSVLKVVGHSETRAKDGFRSERAPRDADARLREKLCVVDGEERIPDMRLSGDNSVAESVVGGPAVGLVPSGRKFVPKTQ